MEKSSCWFAIFYDDGLPAGVTAVEHNDNLFEESRMAMGSWLAIDFEADG
jgi:hypothetical protein